MSVSTHVLDAVTGGPATDLLVALEARSSQDRWLLLAERTTDQDGRITDLAAELAAGVYRIRFDVERYLGAGCFYPEVTVTFRVVDSPSHYHVPLLLSPFAYSTYRGS